MLVVTDIGNTHTVFGIYQGEELLGHWRVVSATHRTSDEYAAYVSSLLASRHFSADEIEGGILGSVVPQLTSVWSKVWMQVAGIELLCVEPGMKTGLDIHYEDPREVGADRIANSVAAIAKYGAPIIIVDFGTATTFDVCQKPNIYLGGMIAPGVQLALEALTGRAARLPRVELAPPESVVGRNTVQAILSGTFFGNVSLVDGLIRRTWDELQCETVVVATGGLGEIMFSHSDLIGHYEPDLTLDGLSMIYRMNM
ncbi:type III pantothenate kinase [bacterium]|nr:type III pantothenate kinase [bacterium]